MQTDNYDWKTDHRHETPANLKASCSHISLNPKILFRINPQNTYRVQLYWVYVFLLLNVHFNWDLLC